LSYSSAVAQLYELGHELARTPSHKFDLAHMRVLLEALGFPHRQFRSVLIAGTNGKGSTAATLASIVRAAGHRTGLYTSPHLVRINERIRINGQPISDADFTRTHAQVETAAVGLVQQGKLPWHPSFFEVLTAMAFLHFSGWCGVRPGEPTPHPVDLAVLEVGMGGRLDATNVVEPLVSVITDISLDHQKFLGNTVREIAGEKAGIIRPGGTVVTLPQHPEANDVIGNTILQRDARAVSAVPYVPPMSPGTTLGEYHPDPERALRVEGEESAVDVCHSDLESRHSSADRAQRAEGKESAFARNSQLTIRSSYPVTVMGEDITVASPLLGRHQWRNLALAIATAVELNLAGLRITPRDIERGIAETRWPGRFQVVTLPRASEPVPVPGAVLVPGPVPVSGHDFSRAATASRNEPALAAEGIDHDLNRADSVSGHDFSRAAAASRKEPALAAEGIDHDLSRADSVSGHDLSRAATTPTKELALAAEGIDHDLSRADSVSGHDFSRAATTPTKEPALVAAAVEELICVLDVAHNPAGAWALRAALSQRFEGRPLLFVFGAMRDKAIAEMAEILFPLAERVFATCAKNPRSAAAEEIRDCAARTGAEIEIATSVRDAIEAARRRAPAGAVVVITGSIYVVGEAMQAMGLATHDY
jgi:dihydrofolate synthase / folylpolyglutamate synthase